MANEGTLHPEAGTVGSIITGAWPIWPFSTLSQAVLETQGWPSPVEQIGVADDMEPNGNTSNAQACL